MPLELKIALMFLVTVMIWLGDAHLQQQLALLRLRQRLKSIRTADEMLADMERWGR